MLSEDGKIVLTIVLFVAGIFACGYFVGWSRDKLAGKIFDKVVSQWNELGNFEEHVRLLIRRLDEKDKEISELKAELEEIKKEER